MTKYTKIAGIAVVLVAMLALVALGGAALAHAQDQAEPDGIEPGQGVGDGPGLVDREIIHSALAEALGMTVEELEAALADGKSLVALAEEQGVDLADVRAAMEAAWAEAIEQAVEDGRITQEQADNLLNRSWQLGPGGRGGRGFGHHGSGFRFGLANREEMQEALADALGISVEELQDAQNEALATVVQQAVEDGRITQEQADLILAMSALKDVIDPEALLAGVLGITVEELQAARDEGTLPELMEELGLDPADVREATQAALEEAVQQAADDGIITQDQADQILSQQGFGPGARGGRGFGEGLEAQGGLGFGRGFGRGFGGFQGNGTGATPADAGFLDI